MRILFGTYFQRPASPTHLTSESIMRLCLLLLLTVLLPLTLCAQDAVVGVVFHDANGNGALDAGEPGIEGVQVSNGSDVTTTDGAGGYRLPATDDMIVFVVKPRNWRPPVDAHNLPQFFYRHKPNGSPADLDFAGVAPTGPLPASVDFPLLPHPELDRFRILVFGDPQPYSLTQVDFVANDIISELLYVEGVQFGITMGDIVGDDLDLFQPLNEAIGKIGVPWYNVYGNHDMNFDVVSDLLADETFERVYGPATYAFQVGRVHFIVFDDVIYPSGIEGRSYVGGLREDQFAFIRNYVATIPPEELIVLNMHIPIEYERDTFRKADRDRLFSILDGHPNTLSLSAHTHLQRHLFFDEATGWGGEGAHHHFNVGTTSGSWWNGIRSEIDIPHTMMRDGTPNGYAFITFSGAEYTIDYKVAGSPAEHQMNIHTPRAISQQPDSAAVLSVNFFNGNEYTDVRYRLGRNALWSDMPRVEAVDPFYDLLAQRWEDFRSIDVRALWSEGGGLALPAFPGTPLPGRAPSSHLWQSPLPAGLPVGTHVVEVWVTDMFGRDHYDAHTFRVVAE